MKAFVYDMNGACTSNGYLSSCLADFLDKNLIDRASGIDDADVVLVLGCNEHERNLEVTQTFRRLAVKHPGKRVVNLGCVPAVPGPERRAGDNFFLLPLYSLLRDPALLGRAVPSSTPFEFKGAEDALAGRDVHSVRARYPDPGSLAYLRIADGCLGKCSFCAIVHGKGSLKSVPPGDIVREAKAALAKGKKRFVFLGEDAGPWGRDLGLDLGLLLRELSALDPEARFLIPAFSPQFLHEVLDRIEPHLPRVELVSLQIQSGNQRVLDLMRREYDIERVKALLPRIRKASPKTLLVTDAIVGFPTETMDEFMDTVRAATLFDATYFFVCTLRPFTPASKLPETPRAEIDRRVEVVRRLKERFNFCDSYIR